MSTTTPARTGSYDMTIVSPPREVLFIHTSDRLAWAVSTRRVAQNLSVDELAERAQVLVEEILNIEKGQPQSGTGAVNRILGALGIKASALPIDLLPFSAPKAGGEIPS